MSWFSRLVRRPDPASKPGPSIRKDSFYIEYIRQIVLTGGPSERSTALDEIRRREDLRGTFFILACAALIATFITLLAQTFIAVGGTSPGPSPKTASVLSVIGSGFIAVIWSTACTAAGAMIGFLFGIPRTSQDVPTNTAHPSQQNQPYRLSANTNLEQISDWLTKIIVGVSLVQLANAPDFFRRATHFMASCGVACPSLAGAVLIAFLVIGFAFGYLGTRMFLSPAFYRADEASLPQSTRIEAGTGGASSSSQKPVVRVDTSIRETASGSFSATVIPVPVATWQAAEQFLQSGNYQAAVEKYRLALANDPNNPELHYGYAVALYRSDASPAEVERELLTAYQGRQNLTFQQQADLYDFLVYFYLYPPNGFENAIRYGDEYLSIPGRPEKPDLYGNLACAYAQKYAARKEAGASAEELRQLKDKVLDLMTRAIAGNDQWRQWFRELIEPKPGMDDDLSVFRSDPDVRAKAGLPPAPK